MTPILLAAIGGLFSELAGVLNIALEGLMLIGAFGAVLFTYLTGNMFLGTLFGLFLTLLVTWLFSYISLRWKANIFIAGLAANLLAVGLTGFLSVIFFKTKGGFRLPAEFGLPRLFGFSIFVYIGWILLAAAFFVIYKTVFGLRLRSVGLAEETAFSRGINTTRYKYAAFLISGLMAGLAGASISLNLNVFVPNMIAGKGWIALVAVYLGYKHPIGIGIACFLFAFAEHLSNIAQGVINIPATIILAFPYLFTVVGLIIFSIIKSKRKKQ